MTLDHEVVHRRGDWAQARPKDSQGPRLSFDLPDRIHLDLYTADRADQAAEVARLIALGASEVSDWPYRPDSDFMVLADPSGNLFCVVPGGETD